MQKATCKTYIAVLGGNMGHHNGCPLFYVYYCTIVLFMGPLWHC